MRPHLYIAAVWALGLISSAEAQSPKGAVTEPEEPVRLWIPASGHPSSRTTAELSFTSVKLKECARWYRGDDFVHYLFEDDAVQKELRFKGLYLDQYDVNWIMNVVQRRRSCMVLLDRVGFNSPLRRLQRWLNSW